MTEVDIYTPGAEKFIENAARNARECEDYAWADKLESAYAKDYDMLDDAFITVFREWAAKHNL